MTVKKAVNIHQACLQDIDIIAPQFDAYRQFYQQKSDLARAKDFLLARLSKMESVIFWAREEGINDICVGFTQLYPSFSSVSTAPIFILNDLYVDLAHRNLGVALKLLTHAKDYAKKQGAVRLILSTAHSNQAAQALYEKNHWQPDTQFKHYVQSLLDVNAT